MAAAIPVIASFGAAASAVSAAGGIAAAMGTVSGFLSVAGAALTGIGALTGKKDLLKVGGLMSLGGGLGNLFGSAAQQTAMQTAQEGFRASELGANAATNAAAEAATGLAGASPASGLDQAMGAAQKAGNAFEYPDAFGQAAQGDTGAFGSIFDKAAANQAGGLDPAATGVTPPGTAQPSVYDVGATRAGGNPAGMPSGVTINGQVMSIDDPLQAAAQGMDSATVDALKRRAAQKTGMLSLDNIGATVKNNKELFSLVGGALNSMYGPQADALQYQKSIMARRLQNMNNPVALTFGG